MWYLTVNGDILALRSSLLAEDVCVSPMYPPGVNRQCQERHRKCLVLEFLDLAALHMQILAKIASLEPAWAQVMVRRAREDIPKIIEAVSVGMQTCMMVNTGNAEIIYKNVWRKLPFLLALSPEVDHQAYVEHKFEQSCSPMFGYTWRKFKIGVSGCPLLSKANDDQYGWYQNKWCLDYFERRDTSQVCGEADTLVQGFEISWHHNPQQLLVHNLLFHRPSNPQGHYTGKRSGDTWVRCSSGFLWGIHGRGGADTFNEVGCLKPDSLAVQNQGSSRSFNMRDLDKFKLDDAHQRYFICPPGMFVSGISAQHASHNFQVECRYMSSPRNLPGDYSLSSLRANATADDNGR
mmetsp:Transcript_79550/g.156083  ORF Transcript_79550/g.156083 Transcript_79550/m.156083 type:complete len:349 (-) Transcript_79550:307-1353(-)